MLKSEGVCKQGAMGDEGKAIVTQFHDAVNMLTKELETWLDTDAEQKDAGGESTGHKMGRTIMELLSKKQSDCTADIHEMGRVMSYVHRHIAQQPNVAVVGTRWSYSPVNWGHAPLRT